MRRPKNAMGLPIHRDGDEVTITDGFIYQCCDCSLSHRFYPSVDDDGTVKLRVFRDDATTERMRALEVRNAFNAPDTNHPPFCVPVKIGPLANGPISSGDANPRKVTPMFARDNYPPLRPREPIVLDSSDPAAYDEHGMVRDGVRIRVRLQTMDAAPPQRSTTPMHIRTGLPLRGPDSLARHFFIDGTEKPKRSTRPVDDPDEGDDYLEEQIDDAMRAAASPHRPGFRFADAGRATVDQGQALKDSAYAEMCTFISNQWRGEPEHQQAADARTTADARPPAGVSAAEFEYSRMVAELNDAWRPKDAKDAALPKVLPLGAWEPGPTRAEGSSCSTGQGERGTWQQGSDGLMRCVPIAQRAVTVEPTNRSTDAQPGTRAHVDAVWHQMCDELVNAWRS